MKRLKKIKSLRSSDDDSRFSFNCSRSHDCRICSHCLSSRNLGSLIRFLIWAFFIAFVGTRILPEPETESNTGELIRTLGFAYAPGLLVVLKIVPIISAFVDPVVTILQLAAMTIAVRQALDFNSTVRAVGVCIVAFILMIVALTLFIGFTAFFVGVAENAVAPTAPLMET